MTLAQIAFVQIAFVHQVVVMLSRALEMSLNAVWTLWIDQCIPLLPLTVSFGTVVVLKLWTRDVWTHSPQGRQLKVYSRLLYIVVLFIAYILCTISSYVPCRTRMCNVHGNHARKSPLCHSPRHWHVCTKEKCYNTTVEPQNNGQVSAGGFVRYSEVSFREVIYHNYKVILS